MKENINRIYDSDEIIIDILEEDKLRISYFKDNHWKGESTIFNFRDKELSEFIKDSW
jgi:hypothetical protein